MAQTFEAIIDQDGNIQLLEPVHLSSSKRALVTILEDPISTISETTMLSEKSLAEDWLKSEEDKAWSHLKPVE